MRTIYFLLLILACNIIFAENFTWSELHDGRKFRVTDNFVYLDEDGNDVSIDVAWSRTGIIIRVTANELTRLYENKTEKEFWGVSEGKLIKVPCGIANHLVSVTGEVFKIDEEARRVTLKSIDEHLVNLDFRFNCLQNIEIGDVITYEGRIVGHEKRFGRITAEIWRY
jgi:hypothetical protein